MLLVPNSFSARESGRKPKKDKMVGPTLSRSTGKVDDVLTRLSEAVIQALATGATQVDGKTLDHGQAEELRKLIAHGYSLMVTTVESLSHISEKSGDAVWGRGWTPDTSSRLTLEAIDLLGQPVGTYGLTLASGKLPEKAAKAAVKPASRKPAVAEAGSMSSYGYMGRSGFYGPRKKRKKKR